MFRYLVNTIPQASGENEVHREDCGHLPSPANRHYLGSFNNCKAAVKAAKILYKNVDGCYYCCNDCHNR